MTKQKINEHLWKMILGCSIIYYDWHYLKYSAVLFPVFSINFLTEIPHLGVFNHPNL